MALFSAMAGTGPCPLEWWIARLCEEFPCYGPEEAFRAWRRAPVGFLEQVVEYRHAAALKAAYDAADTPEKRNALPESDVIMWLREQEFAEAQQALDEAKAKREAAATQERRRKRRTK